MMEKNLPFNFEDRQASLENEENFEKIRALSILKIEIYKKLHAMLNCKYRNVLPLNFYTYSVIL